MTARDAPLSGKRICVLTTGHLSTTPRMTKAADAFAEAGATVHVVSTRSTPWAVAADEDVRRRRPGSWTWDVVDYRREAGSTYVLSGLRQRSALLLSRLAGSHRIPLRIAGCARERVFPELASLAGRVGADFVYGGGAGLTATKFAAMKLGVPFGVDLEDYHPGDQPDTLEGRLFQGLSARIERDVLPAAILRTAGSEDIAEAYRARHELPFVTVNNTFSVSGAARSATSDSGALRLYWFSQTIGPGRGLEDAVAAVASAAIDAELHLQGRPVESYVRSLVERAGREAPRLRIVVHPPCFPDEMVAECARYDVGLALETSDILNRALCLTNKALAYVAAGMAVALSDTPGQRRLASDLGSGAVLYRSGDARRLAEKLAEWSSDRDSLRRAKGATVQAGLARWNWDHAAEKGALVTAVERCLSR